MTINICFRTSETNSETITSLVMKKLTMINVLLEIYIPWKKGYSSKLTTDEIYSLAYIPVG